MDEKKNPGFEPENEPDYLTDPVVAEEILPDEDAMAAAGLTHPNDAEVERLLWEAREQLGEPDAPADPQGESQEETPQESPFRDEEYTEAFGTGGELERVFSGEAYDDSPEEPLPQDGEETLEDIPKAEPMVIRKGRPKRKKGYGLFGLPHIFATAVWLLIVAMIGVSLGRLIWVCAADVLAFGRDEMEVTVSIDDADTIEDISQKLQNAGLIRYRQLFELYANLTDAREDISSGTFTLNTIYDYHALVNSMSTYSSTRAEVTVMIPEGYNCEQLFALLEEKGVCTAEELKEYAANGELDEYWFLEDVERGSGNALEGFLFPDTYNFYVNDDPERVLEKMLDNFENRFTDDMIAAIDTLNERLSNMMRSNGYDETYIAENQFGIRQVVIVASLIEEETAGIIESATISSVIYNRLTNQANYPYLDIDATLMYVLGHKEELTAEDLQTDSPYNTRTHKGLVPGPISNPGTSSLSAALKPEDTGYYYYALDPETGTHHFSRNYDEHMAFLATVSYE